MFSKRKTGHAKKAALAALAVLLVATFLVMPGCQGKKAGTEEPIEPVTVGDKKVTSGFDFGVFKQAIGEDKTQSKSGNVFLSPASLRIALMMTYNGADGNTRQEMAKVLGIEGMTLEEVNKSYSTLMKALESSDPKVKLEIANSLWGKKGIDFNEDFIQRNKEYYGAEVREITGAEPINKWVSEKTHGKIKKVIDQIKPLTILFLINAIYFKGTWTQEFDKGNTGDRDFTLPDGSKIQVPLMSQSGDYDYFENEQFQAIELPYGDEEKMSMYVLLPKEVDGLDQLLESLNSNAWESWISQFTSRKGDISLPKFKLEYEKELVQTLQALGMIDAFNPDNADFAKMVSRESLGGENAYITRVLQKTYVDVNEEGTEAAAATTVEVGVTSVPEPEERFQMVVDHPFFFAIRENQTGTLLFMGSIVNPG